MSAPPLLILDTDVLLQLLISKHAPLLRRLKTEYGIQPAIVPEVEAELEPRGARRGVPAASILKSTASGAVLLLDEHAVRDYLLQQNVPVALAAEAATGIVERVSEYSMRVDLGEAATLAVAAGLGVPAASNDGQAVKALSEAGFPLPQPTMRFFDLVVFGFQAGLLTESECDSIRGRLLGSKEYIPPDFRNQSFKTGLGTFPPRLIDGSKELAGRSPVAAPQHAQALILPGPITVSRPTV
jgi:hypothetical protein